MLLEKKILLGKLCKWTKKLTLSLVVVCSISCQYAHAKTSLSWSSKRVESETNIKKLQALLQKSGMFHTFITMVDKR